MDRIGGSKEAFAVLRTFQQRHKGLRNVACLASIRRRRPESTNYRYHANAQDTEYQRLRALLTQDPIWEDGEIIATL